MNVDGYLKESFKQSTLLEVATWVGIDLGQAKTGICEALTWKWIKRLATKQNVYSTPKVRMDALLKDSTFLKAVNAQKNHDQRGTHRVYNVPNVKAGFGYDQAYLKELRLHGGGIFLSFACPRYNNEKHSVGVYIVPTPGNRLLNPAVLVFDANEGEYEMTAGVFTVWLPAFLGQKYGARVPGNILETQRIRPQ